MCVCVCVCVTENIPDTIQQVLLRCTTKFNFFYICRCERISKHIRVFPTLSVSSERIIKLSELV